MNVKALELIGTLIVGGDDTLDGHELPRKWARRATALHGVNAEHIVVGDGASRRCGDTDGTDDVGDVDRERLIGLAHGVAVDVNGKGVRGASRRNRLPRERVSNVV